MKTKTPDAPLMRHPYSPRLNSAITFEGNGRTKQSMKDECDVNLIVANYDRTGMLTHINESAGLYMDVSEVGDYRTALDNVLAVESVFMKLPSATRAALNNDPALYLDLVSDPEANRATLVDLGLLAETPPVAPKTPPTPAKAPEPPKEPEGS